MILSSFLFTIFFVATASLQTSNLITNPNGDSGLTVWTFTGDWAVYQVNTGSGTSNYFRTSFSLATATQTVDLLNYLSASVLSSTSTRFLFGETIVTGTCGNPTPYGFTATLRDALNNQLATYSYPTSTVPCPEYTLTTWGSAFENIGSPYGSTPRYMTIVHSGQDSVYWGGFFGTGMYGTYIQILYSDPPTPQPTYIPSFNPTRNPTFIPTALPSPKPTASPTGQPTSQPTRQPSSQPTRQPSRQPNSHPTSEPTRQPSSHPTSQPTSQPTREPSTQPTTQPTSNPTLNLPRLNCSDPSILYTPKNQYSFAVLRRDGSVVAWGDPERGGSLGLAAPFLESGVISITSNLDSFCALRSDGSVVCWGLVLNDRVASWTREGFPQTEIASTAPVFASGVTQLVATDHAFAGVTGSGSVVAFGLVRSGGGATSFDCLASDQQLVPYLTSGVQSLISTSQSFAAIKADGSYVTWGDPLTGGGHTNIVSSPRSPYPRLREVGSSRSAFFFVTSRNSLISLGLDYYLGNLGSLLSSSSLNHGVFRVFTSNRMIGVMFDDHTLSVFPVGSLSSLPSFSLSNVGLSYSEVACVSFSLDSVSVLHQDGLLSFDTPFHAPTFVMDSQVQFLSPPSSLLRSSVRSSTGSTRHYLSSMVSNDRSFAALTSTGEVVAWGEATQGGQIPATNKRLTPSSFPSSQPTTSPSVWFVKLFPAPQAFFALSSDGLLYPWGRKDFGGQLDASSLGLYPTSSLSTTNQTLSALAAPVHKSRSLVTPHRVSGVSSICVNERSTLFVLQNVTTQSSSLSVSLVTLSSSILSIGWSSYGGGKGQEFSLSNFQSDSSLPSPRIVKCYP